MKRKLHFITVINSIALIDEQVLVPAADWSKNTIPKCKKKKVKNSEQQSQLQTGTKNGERNVDPNNSSV